MEHHRPIHVILVIAALIKTFIRVLMLISQMPSQSGQLSFKEIQQKNRVKVYII